MGLLDRLRRRLTGGGRELSPARRRARELVADLARAVDAGERRWNYRFEEELAPILAAPPEVQAATALELLESRKWGRKASWDRQRPCYELLNRLFRRKLPFEQAELVALTIAFAGNRPYQASEPSFVGLLERCLAGKVVESLMLEALTTLEGSLEQGAQQGRAAVKRIGALRGGREPEGLDPGEPWSERVQADLEAMPAAARQAWQALLDHAGSATPSRPSKKWLAEAARLCEAIRAAHGPAEEDPVAASLASWFAEVKKPRELEPLTGGHAWAFKPPISDDNAVSLRGLVWTASQIESPGTLTAIARLAEVCFQKIPDFGAVNRKVGNACLWGLGNARTLEGVAWLARLQRSIRYASARKLIARATEEAAERAGMSSADLEEVALPDFGLGLDGVRRQRLGDWTAVLELLPNDQTSITWRREATGGGGAKRQKSAPKAVKEQHPGELKELRREAKAIQQLLPGQRHRFESFYLDQREWPLELWRERYLEHPLAAHLARRLVWRFSRGETSWLGIWLGGSLVDVEGRGLSLDAGVVVTLWHPIESAVEEVHAWRRFFRRHEVTQPFKQAHREVYLLTEAEAETEVYSNRFAAHILKQHQVASLLGSRGWRYQLQGGWDSHNVPFRVLDRHDLTAQFWLEPIAMDEMTDAGIFVYVSSDQVCFTRPDEGERLPLTEVPALVFSEIMRDVDLFVSISSIGADPTWSEERRGALTDYWTGFAFGDLGTTGESRREILAELLPSLAARKLEIDGKWLRVEGKLNRYRIHLGSGSIQRDPGGHVCIVPAPSRGGAKVRLPYEGDRLLSIILSKALMLVHDDKITDRTILAQIR